ncbi:hypothetical protein GCM10023192_16010 [Amycolatopsis samaneae]
MTTMRARAVVGCYALAVTQLSTLAAVACSAGIVLFAVTSGLVAISVLARTKTRRDAAYRVLRLLLGHRRTCCDALACQRRLDSAGESGGTGGPATTIGQDAAIKASDGLHTRDVS